MNETSATSLSDFFDEDFVDVTKLSGDDLYSILESLDDVAADFPPLDEEATTFAVNEEEALTKAKKKSNKRNFSQKSSSSETFSDDANGEIETPKRKRAKKKGTTSSGCSDQEAVNAASSDGQGKVSHIAVERNRRKQMNEHLTVLRSLMPCFYVKRGDQASIIGGVVDYINELQQVLQSLEAKKQRKIYNEVLSPRLVISQSPRLSPTILSPRKPPLSPRLSLPISPRTPQPGSPYKPRLQQSHLINSPTAMLPNNNNNNNNNYNGSLEPSPTSSTASSNIVTVNDNINELSASSKSEIADVEVKFSGLNLVLKTVSPRIMGQAAKIISAIEDLSLEILNVNISTIDETMFHSFTIKIGVECQLSAEELAHHIQQTFC